MLALAVLFVTVTVLLILYWIKTKHPKGFPPGPRGVPLLGYLPWLAPNPHIEIGKLGKTYGNIFSLPLGRYTYVILNDLETVKSALKLDVFAGRPNHLLPMESTKLGLVYNQGPGWVEQRRFALRTLRDFGFGKKSMEVSIQEEVTDIISYFRARLNQPLCVKEFFSISIVNALWSMIAGAKFAFDDPKPREYFCIGKEGFFDQELQGAVWVMPWYAKLFPKHTGLAEFEHAIVTFKTMLRGLVEEHQRTFVPNSPRDYIDMYLEKMAATTDPDSSFYGEAGVLNLIDGMVALFMGGSDPLTSTMEFTLLYLVTFPNVRYRIQDELDRVVGKSRVPDINDRSSLPYLEAVMQESMRMSSVVAGAVPHATMEDVEFMGYNLPKGTIVMPNLYEVHYNEKYWKDPENFRPERFINEDGTFRKDENVIPFSIGKRVCMAETIAMTEYFLFVSNILQQFDIEADPDTPLPGLEARKSAYNLSPKHYKIIFSERA